MRAQLRYLREAFIPSSDPSRCTDIYVRRNMYGVWMCKMYGWMAKGIYVLQDRRTSLPSGSRGREGWRRCCDNRSASSSSSWVWCLGSEAPGEDDGDDEEEESLSSLLSRSDGELSSSVCWDCIFLVSPSHAVERWNGAIDDAEAVYTQTHHIDICVHIHPWLVYIISIFSIYTPRHHGILYNSFTDSKCLRIIYELCLEPFHRPRPPRYGEGRSYTCLLTAVYTSHIHI